MPVRLFIPCPIDGLDMSAPNQTATIFKGNSEDRVGDHVHTNGLRFIVECANGHRWGVNEEISLNRVR